MTTVTLEQIHKRQAELAALIAQLSPGTATRREIVIEATEIELAPGEHYAGAVLDEHGELQHHLVVMSARPDKRQNWKQSLAWAEEVGGALPTRQEAALLYANCKPHLEAAWHWTCEEYEGDASDAWGCRFDGGDQYVYYKSFEARAVAVRRV